MVKKYRSSWEIILEILTSCCGEGDKKTRIMYKANLNYVSFNTYFKALLEAGLIKRVTNSNGGFVYRITEKGRSLMKVLNEAKNAIPKKAPT